MTIYGMGLTETEQQALVDMLRARGSVPIKERVDLEIPDEFLVRTSNKYLFAFWLQFGLIKQDRPLLFWVGIFFFVYAILSGTIQILIKIIQLIS